MEFMLLLHAVIEVRSVATSQIKNCCRAFAKLLHGQSRNITSLSWIQLKYAQIKGDEYLGLGVSDTIFKIKLVELFENDISIQNDYAESKRCFIVTQLIIRSSHILKLSSIIKHISLSAVMCVTMMQFEVFLKYIYIYIYYYY